MDKSVFWLHAHYYEGNVSAATTKIVFKCFKSWSKF